jgi:hypothetical protein
MSWPELIENYSISQPRMRLSYGNRRFDTRAVKIMRTLAHELDIDIGDTRVDLPSFFHNIIVLDMENLRNAFQPIAKRNETMNSIDRVGGKKMQLVIDNQDYYIIKDTLSPYISHLKRWLNDPITFVQAILIDNYQELDE